MTEDASIVAAECILSEVDGDDVDMGRFAVVEVEAVEAEGVACLMVPDDAGA